MTTSKLRRLRNVRPCTAAAGSEAAREAAAAAQAAAEEAAAAAEENEARVQLTFDEQKAVMAEMFGRIEELFALKTTLEQQLVDAEAGGGFRSGTRPTLNILLLLLLRTSV